MSIRGKGINPSCTLPPWAMRVSGSLTVCLSLKALIVMKIVEFGGLDGLIGSQGSLHIRD
jgi:hypothetical protein